MLSMFRLTKKFPWQLLGMVVGLMPFQASFAVVSSSVSAASTAKAKPAPAKPAAVIVTKAAPAKPASPTVKAKPTVTAKPLVVSSVKPAAKVNANGASQKSAPVAYVAPSTVVPQTQAVQP